MKNTYIMFAVALVLVAGGSFYGGMAYQSSKQGGAAGPQLAQGGGGFPGGGFGGNTAGGQNRTRTGGNRMMQGGGFTSGDVLSKDDKSLTIQTRDGSSKIVFFTPTTKVSKMVDGAMTDVTEKLQVSVVGSTNPDGSITAEQVQIRPNMPLPPGGPASSTSTSPAPAQP